jgi:hypothetical protein
MRRFRQIASSKFLKSRNWRVFKVEKKSNKLQKKMSLDLHMGEDLWITGHE